MPTLTIPSSTGAPVRSRRPTKKSAQTPTQKHVSRSASRRRRSEERRRIRLANVESALHDDEPPELFAATLHIQPEASRAAIEKFFGVTAPTHQSVPTPAPAPEPAPRSPVTISATLKQPAITPKGRLEKKAKKAPFTSSRHNNDNNNGNNNNNNNNDDDDDDDHDELEDATPGATPTLRRIVLESSQVFGGQTILRTPRTVRMMLMTPSKQYNTPDAMLEDELASPEKGTSRSAIRTARSPGIRNGRVHSLAVRTSSPSISRSYTMDDDESDDELATVEVQTYKVKMPRKKTVQISRDNEDNPARILRYALEAVSHQRGRSPIRRNQTKNSNPGRMDMTREDGPDDEEKLGTQRNDSFISTRHTQPWDREVQVSIPNSIVLEGNKVQRRKPSLVPSDPGTSVSLTGKAISWQSGSEEVDDKMGERDEETDDEDTILPDRGYEPEDTGSPSGQLELEASFHMEGRRMSSEEEPTQELAAPSPLPQSSLPPLPPDIEPKDADDVEMTDATIDEEPQPEITVPVENVDNNTESISEDEPTIMNTQLEAAVNNDPLNNVSFTAVYGDRALTEGKMHDNVSELGLSVDDITDIGDKTAIQLPADQSFNVDDWPVVEERLSSPTQVTEGRAIEEEANEVALQEIQEVHEAQEDLKIDGSVSVHDEAQIGTLSVEAVEAQTEEAQTEEAHIPEADTSKTQHSTDIVSHEPDIESFVKESPLQGEYATIDVNNVPCTQAEDDQTLPALHNNRDKGPVDHVDATVYSDGSTKVISMTPGAFEIRGARETTPTHDWETGDFSIEDSDIIISSPLAEPAMSFPLDLDGNPLKRKRFSSSEPSTPYVNPLQRALDAYDADSTIPRSPNIEHPTKATTPMPPKIRNFSNFWGPPAPTSSLAFPQYGFGNTETKPTAAEEVVSAKSKAAAVWTSEMAIRSSPRHVSPLPRHSSKRTRHQSPRNRSSPSVQLRTPLVEATAASRTLAAIMETDIVDVAAEESIIEETILFEAQDDGDEGGVVHQNQQDDGSSECSVIDDTILSEAKIVPKTHTNQQRTFATDTAVVVAPVSPVHVDDDVTPHAASSSPLSSAASSIIDVSLNSDVAFAPTSSFPEVSRTPRFPRLSQTTSSYIEPDTDSELEASTDDGDDKEETETAKVQKESKGDSEPEALSNIASADIEVDVGVEVDIDNSQVECDSDGESDALSECPGIIRTSSPDLVASHLKERISRLERFPVAGLHLDRLASSSSSLSSDGLSDFSFDEAIQSTQSVLAPLLASTTARETTKTTKTAVLEAKPLVTPLCPARPRTPSPPPTATISCQPHNSSSITTDNGLSPSTNRKKQALAAADSANIYDLPDSPRANPAQQILERARLSRSQSRSRIRPRRSIAEIMARGDEAFYGHAPSPIASGSGSGSGSGISSSSSSSSSSSLQRLQGATLRSNPPETPATAARTRITVPNSTTTTTTTTTTGTDTRVAPSLAIDEAPSPWMDEPSSVNFGSANSPEADDTKSDRSIIPRFPGPSQLPIDDTTPSALEKNPWAPFVTSHAASVSSTNNTIMTSAAATCNSDPLTTPTPTSVATRPIHKSRLHHNNNTNNNNNNNNNDFNYRSLHTPSRPASPHGFRRPHIMDLLPSSTRSSRTLATPAGDDFVVRSFASFMSPSAGRNRASSGRIAGTSPARTAISGGILKPRNPNMGTAHSRRARKRVQWEPALGSTAIVTVVKTGMERSRRVSPPPEVGVSMGVELGEKEDGDVKVECGSRLAAKHLDAMKKRGAVEVAMGVVGRGRERLLPTASQQVLASQAVDAMAVAFLVADNDVVPGSRVDTESYPEMIKAHVGGEEEEEERKRKRGGEGIDGVMKERPVVSRMPVAVDLLGSEDTELDMGDADGDGEFDDVGYVMDNLEDFLGIPLSVDEEIKKQAQLAARQG